MKTKIYYAVILFALANLLLGCNYARVGEDKKATPAQETCDANAYPFGGGAGIIGNPYRVCSVGHFYAMDNVSYVNSHFKQMADINFSGYNFDQPRAFPSILFYTDFNGVYDGNNFKISNIKSYNQAADWALFFHQVGAAGIVKNVTFANLNIKTTEAMAIIHTNAGLIQNVQLKNSVIVCESSCAGIVAFNSGTIKNAAVQNTTIAAEWYVGGISLTSSGPIIESYSTGNLVTQKGHAGGIARECDGGSIIDSASLMNIHTSYRSSAMNLGGLAGRSIACTIDGGYFVGSINANTGAAGETITNVGGITGYAEMATSFNTLYLAPSYIFAQDPTAIPGGVSFYYGIGEDGDASATYGSDLYVKNNPYAPVEQTTNFTAKAAGLMRLQMAYPLFDFNDLWQMSSDARYALPVFKHQSASLPFGSPFFTSSDETRPAGLQTPNNGGNATADQTVDTPITDTFQFKNTAASGSMIIDNTRFLIGSHYSIDGVSDCLITPTVGFGTSCDLDVVTNFSRDANAIIEYSIFDVLLIDYTVAGRSYQAAEYVTSQLVHANTFIDKGNVYAGAFQVGTSNNFTVTIQNNSAFSGNITLIEAPSAPFAPLPAGTTCAVGVMPDLSTCDIQVTFAPTAKGHFKATYDIEYLDNSMTPRVGSYTVEAIAY